MSGDEAYKAAKVAFVSNNAGDSVLRINVLCSTALTTYALWCALSSSPYGFKSSVILDFVILCLPLLLVLTILSNHVLLVNGVIGVLALILVKVAPSKRDTPDEAGSEGLRFNRPFVTVYRAHMMLMTVICILAVDFPVFPRSFGKCETFGTSIMDIGVGSFVFTLGLVQALPILRSNWTPPLRSRLATACKSCLPVIALGIGRVIMVKGVDYPEHITEYGVHWNFFFTLALLPLLGTLMQDAKKVVSFTTLGVAVAILHQVLLSAGLQDWVLDAPRLDFITANKEGIASLPGYLAIYLLGLDTGLAVLPPDPYYAYRSEKKRRDAEQKKPKTGKMLTLLTSLSLAWWMSFYSSVHFVGVKASRQMANASYVLWIAAFNTSYLTLAALLSHHFAGKVEEVPQLFAAINKNSLAIFLVANVLTGLVNLSINTMAASNTMGVVILTTYLAALSLVATILHARKGSIRQRSHVVMQGSL